MRWQQPALSSGVLLRDVDATSVRIGHSRLRSQIVGQQHIGIHAASRHAAAGGAASMKMFGGCQSLRHAANAAAARLRVPAAPHRRRVARASGSAGVWAPAPGGAAGRGRRCGVRPAAGCVGVPGVGLTIRARPATMQCSFSVCLRSLLAVQHSHSHQFVSLHTKQNACTPCMSRGAQSGGIHNP